MVGLLINRKVLLKHKLKKLLEISGTPPKTSYDIGIVYIIPQQNYDKLVISNDKISYISSKTFIDSITDSYFIIYNKEKNLCEIRGHIVNPKHLNEILKSINIYMPNNTTIWAGIIPTNSSDYYIKAGFDNPHIVDHSPLKHKFNGSGIAFSKKNTTTKVSEDTVRNKLIYAATQTGDICNIEARFTHQSVKHLKKINEMKSGKEQAGSLIISKVVKNNGKLIFEFSPDPNSLETGENEEVDAVWNRYNFHTHPKKAYENHGVTRGWPSSQDYVGFLQLDNHTIFHTVVTLEGIYIISLSPEWSGDIKKVDKKYVLKHYDIDHKDKLTFNEYVKKINSKKYKGKSQLFVVYFLSWKNATKTFPVYYSKTGDKCLVTEDNFKIYK